MRPFWALGVADLAETFARGETDPQEVAALYRARIAAVDRHLNCYVALNRALEDDAAESAERLRAGAPRSPLEGVPLAVKDNLVVRGMPATWGSALFAGHVCERDELPVARLRAAGAVILGKTNTPEFAVEGYTSNRLFGTTGNAWSPGLTPGGSSGGTVSAVAAGLAAAGIGTDGGGSIRRPAGYTGLYGLKPTIGAVARAGGLPQVLLDPRLADLDAAPPHVRLADHQLNGGLVVGSGPSDWSGSPMTSVEARLTFDGQVVLEGPVRLPFGEAFECLAALAEMVGAHCGGLRSGHVVITGSLNGLPWVDPGTRIHGRIAGIGDAAVEITR